MIYLGIETTTDVFLLTIGDGTKVIKEKLIEGKRHSELLVRGIEEVLDAAALSAGDLAALGVGVGPGSFTGIRVGMSSAITIAQIKNIPVYGISFMDIMGKTNEHVAVKAFRDKYYYASYSSSGKRSGSYKIVSEAEKELLGAVVAKISSAPLLDEIDYRYKNKINGCWRDIEPVYVMETVYKEKMKN